MDADKRTVHATYAAEVSVKLVSKVSERYVCVYISVGQVDRALHARKARHTRNTKNKQQAICTAGLSLCSPGKHVCRCNDTPGQRQASLPAYKGVYNSTTHTNRVPACLQSVSRSGEQPFS